jgi:uncharacterized membrane protein
MEDKTKKDLTPQEIAEKQQNNHRSPTLRVNRLETLVDGIFAIAMTILVLELKIPEHLSGADQIKDALYFNLFNYVNFIIAFVILSSLWLNNLMQFHCCKQTDRRHIFFNMVSLMFVSVVPFSTSLIGDYPDSFICQIIFHGNQLMIGLFFLLSWYYLHCQDHLRDTECDEAISTKKGIHSTLIYVCISLLAIIITFISPRWSTMSYALLPLFFYVRSKRNNRVKECDIKSEPREHFKFD